MYDEYVLEQLKSNQLTLEINFNESGVIGFQIRHVI